MIEDAQMRQDALAFMMKSPGQDPKAFSALDLFQGIDLME